MLASFRSTLIGLAFAGQLTGCFLLPEKEPDPPPPNTAQYGTNELLPFFSAQTDSNTLRIYARLAAGNQNFLEVGEGDTIYAMVDGTRVPLSLRVEDREKRYVAEVPALDTERTVRISLERAGGKPSALTSETKVPGAFVVSVAEGQNVANNLVVAATVAPGTKSNVLVAGDCITSDYESGYLTFVEGKSKPLTVPVNRGVKCPATIYVRQRADGSLDGNFGRQADIFQRTEHYGERSASAQVTILGP